MGFCEYDEHFARLGLWTTLNTLLLTMILFAYCHLANKIEKMNREKKENEKEKRRVFRLVEENDAPDSKETIADRVRQRHSQGSNSESENDGEW